MIYLHTVCIYICKQPDRIRIGSVSVSDAGCFFFLRKAPGFQSLPASQPFPGFLAVGAEGAAAGDWLFQ